ncbi:MAG: hypothetical protein EA364_03700 [Balneolaceae bacterium]|nr:MAG: hypothetical protein EA364_03700 [Balneolaceae bacterium]
MDWKNAEHLIEKWYAGQTTPKQEQELKHLLQHPGLPEHLIPDREIILALDDASKSELTAPGFDEAVFDAIDEHEQTRIGSRFIYRYRYRYRMLAAAALVIISLTFSAVWFANQQHVDLSQTAYTEEEIRQAEEITDSTLLLISGLLKTGTGELARVAVVRANLEKLDYLTAVYRGIKQLETIPKPKQDHSKQEIES